MDLIQLKINGRTITPEVIWNDMNEVRGIMNKKINEAFPKDEDKLLRKELLQVYGKLNNALEDNDKLLLKLKRIETAKDFEEVKKALKK